METVIIALFNIYLTVNKEDFFQLYKAFFIPSSLRLLYFDCIYRYIVTSFL